MTIFKEEKTLKLTDDEYRLLITELYYLQETPLHPIKLKVLKTLLMKLMRLSD